MAKTVQQRRRALCMLHTSALCDQLGSSVLVRVFASFLSNVSCLQWARQQKGSSARSSRFSSHWLLLTMSLCPSTEILPSTQFMLLTGKSFCEFIPTRVDLSWTRSVCKLQRNCGRRRRPKNARVTAPSASGRQPVSHVCSCGVRVVF